MWDVMSKVIRVRWMSGKSRDNDTPTRVMSQRKGGALGIGWQITLYITRSTCGVETPHGIASLVQQAQSGKSLDCTRKKGG